ncbi:MAG: methionine aminotransferase [Cecembia sp.]
MIRSKLPDVGTTIFTVMSQLAHDHGAINLSQGYPGFDTYPFLRDLLAKYVQEGYNQYAPMTGVPTLKKRIVSKTLNLHDVEFDEEEEVTVVSGATEALYAAVTAVIEPGDEAIILEPAYDSYAPAVRLNGGVPVYVPLNLPDFSVDWQKVKDAISDKTKVIMVNTPHNPGGYVWTQEDLDQLFALIKNREIFVISDEVYEQITFDDVKHLPVFSHPGLRARSFVCGSFGKTFHVTGWKIGYCLAPKALSREFRKIHQFLTFSTSTPMQYALADFMENPSRYIFLNEFYEKKRNRFCRGLKETAFEFIPAQGSFFQVVSYGHLSDEKDTEVAIRMTKEIGVACIPVSAFFHDHRDPKLLRFCFAKEDRDLDKALDRIKTFQF